ncbi:S66 family peptidase [Bacillus marasmi]|uniref:S66 family peptidase n=1 Tax=Bacillus marasmi TaxID=1926279 RepID=UPI0011CC1FAB|nr:S66 peptidase family protein [Bacillus marasmi]
MWAEKLQPGDEIRVIAPSTSMLMIKEKQIEIAVERLKALGFTITYGKNVYSHDALYSSSIEERIEDLHDAFRDTNVKGILAAIGGYSANQLLQYIDYGLIKDNPKIFCGYGDITALSFAFYQKTGLVTFVGPDLASFGVKEGVDYTLQSFLDAVTNDSPFEINPSSFWSEDPWHLEQDSRTYHEQKHYFVIQEGKAEGRIIGGNLSTLNLLKGTEYMPPLKDAVLFIEDDLETHPHRFDRELQALLQIPQAAELRAILIGRFQADSNMTEAALKHIILTKQELKDIPVIANVNIGHVQPFATLPIGATATIYAKGIETEIFIEQTEY